MMHKWLFLYNRICSEFSTFSVMSVYYFLTRKITLLLFLNIHHGLSKPSEQNIFPKCSKNSIEPIKRVSYSPLHQLGPTPPSPLPPYLVIESCPREYHGHLISPLRLVLPLIHLMVPEMQTTRVTHQAVRKFPPDLRTETHQLSFPVQTQLSTVSAKVSEQVPTDSWRWHLHKLRSEYASEAVPPYSNTDIDSDFLQNYLCLLGDFK